MAAPYASVSTGARSTISTTRHDLRLLIGRHSTIATVSPARHVPSSSCAMTFVVRRMNLPYAGCLTRRSIDTVTLFCILLLTTRPIVGLDLSLADVVSAALISLLA